MPLKIRGFRKAGRPGHPADILKEQGYDVRALKPGYKALVLQGFMKAKE